MKHFQIQRKKKKQIKVGSVLIGGNAPIAVQTMTNTLTSNIDATVEQILRAQKAGADIVRVSCPDETSTKALKEIVKQISVPVVADIHFHYKRALEAADNGASCLRINPGNIGSIDRIREVVAAARANNLSIRIGVNAGSLEKNLLKKYKEPCADAMVDSALFHARILEKCNFYDFKISVKASDIFLAIESYRKLSDVCEYPLHVGITEAGGTCAGTVKSALGIGMLLQEGIGDTIRVSLSADPVEEVKVGFNILKALHLRNRGVNIISCPSCARQQFDVIKTVDALERATSHITESITVSLIGCVVNGPGESRQSDIGLTGGGNNTHQIYIKGSASHRIKSQDIVQHMVGLIEEQIIGSMSKQNHCDTK